MSALKLKRHLLAAIPASRALGMGSRHLRAQSSQRVVITRAGPAGLSAARALHDTGAAVTVIEAGTRIGGRIHPSCLWPDLPMDMGASWIHGQRGNPLTPLARSAGARVVATSYGASM